MPSCIWISSNGISRRLNRNAGINFSLPSHPQGSFEETLRECVAEYNRETGTSIRAFFATFQSLLTAVSDGISEVDLELVDLVDDYAQYCAETGLLPRTDYYLRAVPCGVSFSENMELGVYYEPADRSRRNHRYLGVYWNKAIRGVGEVTAVVEATIRDGVLDVISGLPTPEQADRIVAIARQALERHGWDLSEGHRFSVVDCFHSTRFKKTSRGGMRGMKYFDLGHELELDELPPVVNIAELLNSKEWA